ncbi:hypothetical protein, partial [Acinetobacter baumannii]|uniref:hypothetical protein n=1 Tax=Acinetobacter baumannii TaxID=470 RepID=UPI001C07F908
MSGTERTSGFRRAKKLGRSLCSTSYSRRLPHEAGSASRVCRNCREPPEAYAADPGAGSGVRVRGPLC